MNTAVDFERAYEYVRTNPNDPDVRELLNSSENGKIKDEQLLAWWHQNFDDHSNVTPIRRS